MEQVGVFDAKVNLSKLVERVSRGETIVITRHGQPMAKLTPADDNRRPRLDCEQAIAVLHEIRSHVEGVGSVREMIEQGRRY